MVSDAQTPAPVGVPGPAAAQRVIRNSASNLLAQVLYAACNVVVVVVLARGAGKEVLGGYYTLFALVTVVQILLEAGLCTLLTCRIAQAADDWKRLAAEATRLFALVALASLGVFLAGGAVWAWVAGDPQPLLACAAAGAACAGIQLQRLCIGVFRAFDVFRYENAARVLQATLFAALVAALAWGGGVTVAAVAGMLAASHAVAAAFLLTTLQRRWGCLSLTAGPANARTWLRQSVPLGIGDVVRGLAAELDTLLLGVMRPAAAVGVYAVAARPLGPLGWVARGILAAAFPSFARLAVRDPAALDRAAAQSTRLLWVVSLPLAVAVCVCAEPLVLLVAGPEFLDAVLPMRILAWLVPLAFLSHQLRFFFTAAGHQRVYGKLVVAAFAVKAAAVAALIPVWGYLGACAGCILGELVFTAAGLAACRRLGIGRVEWGALGRSALAAGVMAGLVYATLGQPLPLLAAAVAGAGAVYLALCVLLGAVRPDELRQVYDTVRLRVAPPAAGTVLPARPSRGASDTLPALRPQVDLIRAAAAQMTALRAGRVAPPAPLTTAALELSLGEEVRGHDLWRVTWNRIYLVQTARGRTLVAKQVCTQTEAEFLQEYEHFAALARLDIARLDVPRPVARLTPERTYLMDRMRGQTLTAILNDEPDPEELGRACELAGRVLGRVHAAWADAACPVPGDALRHDLALMPGGYTRGQWATIDRALDRLAGVRVAVGQPYLDFNPRNVLHHAGVLSLIDPPKERRRGLLLWDYATFRIELWRELWKDTVRRPWGGRGPLLRAGLAAFERGYTEAAPDVGLGPDRVPLLVRLLELQRVGQLMTQRLTEVGLAARADSPIPRGGGRLRSLGIAVASVGLLRAQKRWLIRRLAEDLAGAGPAEPAAVPGSDGFPEPPARRRVHPAGCGGGRRHGT